MNGDKKQLLSEDEDPYFQHIEAEPEFIPDSVTGGEAVYAEMVSQSARRSQSLLSKLKYPLLGIALLVGITLLWQLSSLYFYLLSLHWSLAAGLLLLTVLIVGSSCRTLWDYLKTIKVLDVLNDLRVMSDRMTNTKSVIEKPYFIRGLKNLYRASDNLPSLEAVLASLPDYSDDSETIRCINDHWLASCDERAQTVVAKCGKDTAVMVALSPFAIADIVLSLWRTLKLIDDISQIYSIKPSLPGRIKLMNLLLRQMALAAGADLVTDQIVELTSNRLVGTLSKQAGTALGVGLYSMRIGFHAMALCRPTSFHSKNRPRFKHAFMDILSTLKP